MVLYLLYYFDRRILVTSIWPFLYIVPFFGIIMKSIYFHTANALRLMHKEKTKRLKEDDINISIQVT
jgi:hypothetical protein